MSDSGGAPDRASVAGVAAAARDRLRDVGLVRAVVAITVLALAARLLFLGARTAHWDEARVAYWILHWIDTGDFVYRRIIHGPLIQHVLHVLFPLLGTSDFVMRLPVALVGGLLPLAALLFRDHLEDEEVLVLALFLAFNAVLLYYSRFMRSDLLVATFMFAALGFLVRLYDTQRVEYLYAAVVLIALGFGSKENAIVYLLTWIGATGLLVGHEFLRWVGLRRMWRRLRADRLTAVREGVVATPTTVWNALRHGYAAGMRGLATHESGVRGWLLHALGALAVFLVITVFLYGARGEMLGIWYQDVPAPWERITVNLGGALADPTALPTYGYETLSYTTEQYLEWLEPATEPGGHEDSIVAGWLAFLKQYVEVMYDHALVLSLFAGVGFLYELFSGGRARNLVLFSSYAGFASVLGYPLGTDVFGAWLVVHAVIPLAIPAAVGVGLVVRWGVEASRDDDRVATSLAAVILVLLATQVAVGNVGSVYTNDTADENTLVQYAQPADDLDSLVGAIERAAAEDRETADVVLYYGVNGSDREDREAIVSRLQRWAEGDLRFRPACAEWWNTLPLPWYLARADANTTCMAGSGALVRQARTDPPAIVVTVASDPTVPRRQLQEAGYESRTFGLRRYGFHWTVFAHERIDAFDNS